MHILNLNNTKILKTSDSKTDSNVIISPKYLNFPIFISCQIEYNIVKLTIFLLFWKQTKYRWLKHLRIAGVTFFTRGIPFRM